MPSLRFIVNVAKAKTLYPHDVEPPAAPPGTEWVPVTINRIRGQYEQFNQPHLNIHDAAAKDEQIQRRPLRPGRQIGNAGASTVSEKNLPPLDPNEKGHFHPESAEFWLVFAGQIRYAFEGQEPFVASEGDVVYVPANTWHATRYVGPIRPAVCRSPNTSATRCCWSRPAAIDRSAEASRSVDC